MLRTLLAAAALLLLAACNAVPGATVAPSAAPTAGTTPGPFTVSLNLSGNFVGPNGHTLYTFDKDTLGHSTCNGECLANWPALTVTSTPAITVGQLLDLAEFTAITRDDGSAQVTYKLIPLYFFAGDTAPGNVNGDGVGGVWHVAKPGSTLPTAAPPTPAGTPAATPAETPASTPGTDCDPEYDYGCGDGATPEPGPATPAASPAATVEPTAGQTPAAELIILLSEDGTYLTDEAGMALYTFDNDGEYSSSCNDDCAVNWPPLLLPDETAAVGGEGVEGEFVGFNRLDETTQVAFNTKPLYYYSGDLEPGDINGDGLNDVWHLASVEPVINPL